MTQPHIDFPITVLLADPMQCPEPIAEELLTTNSRQLQLQLEVYANVP